MFLQLEDNGDFNLSESNFWRGLKAVSTGGASELVRKRNTGTFVPPPCACTNEKNIIQNLTKRLRQCKKATGYQNKVVYNPNTGLAQVMSTPLQDSALGTIIGATPYGAVAKGVLNIGKAIFGKKGSTTQESGVTGISQDVAQAQAKTKEMNDLKLKVTQLTKQNAKLKTQRYYYGGGGLALGLGAGYLLKR